MSRLRMSSSDVVNLETAIITTLSSHPDEFFSQLELYELVKDITCFEKRKFVSCFLTIHNTYKNVHMFTKNKVSYLVWSLKHRHELMEQLTREKIDSQAFLTQEDYLDMIDEALIDGDADFDPNRYMDGNMNSVHMLVQGGCLKTIKKVFHMYHIELDRKTKDDKTVFDIVHATKDMEMLEYLLRYQMGKEIEELYKMIGAQKESFQNVKKDYEKSIKNLKYENKILNILVFIVSFALVFHIFI